ncbi:MAG: transposase, partial [Prevotellaceae bacterium]|nr:transposase [Prevotellaceae bacterium]
MSSEDKEIFELAQQGKKWIALQLGERDVFSEHAMLEEEKQITEHLLGNIENILLNGTQLILSQVFKSIGFDSINDGILKHLAVSRICQPSSKAGTVDYLKSYFDKEVELHKIYHYLDKLHKTQQENVQKISVEHTKRILGSKIG